MLTTRAWMAHSCGATRHPASYLVMSRTSPDKLTLVEKSKSDTVRFVSLSYQGTGLQVCKGQLVELYIYIVPVQSF